jgi:4a-hydroxytetrahydrobiopterin dehydratase
MDLANKKCIPCEVSTSPLSEDNVKRLISNVPHWQISSDGKKIYRHFVFKDFVQSMGFVNQVATLAQEEGHHPDIFVSYNEVVLELWTHNINGLSENDFILAAKINKIL